ncbi:hypothetical protein N177_1842 [Lutibaculum baratangense AMV1]|uniref:Uncharacterized protein n=1 Tax=Lutibaculum baratangense AMV1 TaxID=631454 RepID=V4RQ63_9HYPH|nr:hypothetical protein [Lutibaculum baratangense]ESR25325.1 hypothetical protein N177_1842 [Lutibaculum baratangense AMV1]
MLLGVRSEASYRYARAGEHFVIFRENAGAVSVVDFLHVRSDVATALVRLMDAERGE